MSTTRKNVSEHLHSPIFFPFNPYPFPIAEDLDSKNIVEEVISKAENKTRRYIKGRLLGKGGFARCYEFTNVETKAICAAKIISKSSLLKHRAKQKVSYFFHKYFLIDPFFLSVTYRDQNPQVFAPPSCG